MSPSPVDNRSYYQLLEEFLQRLRDAANEQTLKQITGYPNDDEWERYILELNTFYYQDFYNRFFPSFCEQIDRGIKIAFNTSENDNSTKHNLAQNLIQWARLYNQAQYLHRLANEQLVSLQQQLPSSINLETPVVELIYILKNLSRYSASLLSRQRNRQNILDDREYIDGLQRYPEQRTVSHVISLYSNDSPKTARELNHLLSAWQLALKQLDKMPAKDAINRESVRSLIKELQKADLAWTDRKASPVFRSWYKQNIQYIFQFHVSSLELYGERNDRKRVIHTAVLLSDWLRSLLYVAEQSIGYLDRNWGDLITDLQSLIQIEPQVLSDQIIELSRTIQFLTDLIQSLSSAAADYSLHSQRVAEFISGSLNYWQKYSKNAGATGSALYSEAEWLISQLKLAANQVEILDDRETARESLFQQYHHLQETLVSHCQWLSNLQGGLKEKLNPLKLQRQYPDYTIEVKQTRVAIGTQFPAEFLYLLSDDLIKTTASDGEEGRVTYAEGDIFLIRVDDYQELEIPEIILSRKGSL